MRKRTPPLHSAHIEDADARSEPVVIRDHGMRKRATDVEVIFRNLDLALVREIEKADEVFGCVAWLTNLEILAALARKRAVGIVVQKEDFLRPDSVDIVQARTRAAYAQVPGFERHILPCTSSYSFACDPESEGIRCVGYHNSERRAAFPRMHNKFMVFCSGFEPYAVWTGSFNMTYNAADSMENAVLIRDKDVAASYLDEFGTIFGLSEPLDWTSEWVAPEYRLGT